eukprot:COSAG05_NODE_17509_length_324_cov_0.684444_1_plen_71_part_01
MHFTYIQNLELMCVYMQCSRHIFGAHSTLSRHACHKIIYRITYEKFAGEIHSHCHVHAESVGKSGITSESH